MQKVIKKMTKAIEAGSTFISLEDVAEVARHNAPVALHPNSLEKLRKSRLVVEQCVKENKIVYGITTGFGKLSDTFIDSSQNRVLQRNLLLSHAIGVGEPFQQDIVRAMLFLRLSSLAQGFSGVRPILLEYFLRFLNDKVHPVVPSRGSVGSSGDLAPLAHLSLPLIGEGEVEYTQQKMSSQKVLSHLKLDPLELQAKEGLALINGTQAMTSVASLALFDSASLLKIAQIAAAMTLEATLSSDRFLEPRLQKVRPHPGQSQVAKNMQKLVDESDLIASHKKSLHRIQDAYSIRCVPQVHGAVHEAYAYTKKVIETEINSVTDNPIVFAEENEILSGGNFHGHPVAISVDFFKIALSGLANISERRIERLVNSTLNEGLPPFLTSHSGIHSGMMVCQYTAAALVSENKILSHPASVDSIPTSANQEDYNSMGTVAARNLSQVVENTKQVLALELLCAAQALDFRKSMKFGKGVQAAYACIRNSVPTLNEDRWMTHDLQNIVNLIENDKIREEVEGKVGALQL